MSFLSSILIPFSNPEPKLFVDSLLRSPRLLVMTIPSKFVSFLLAQSADIVNWFFGSYGYHGTSFEQTYRCYSASFTDTALEVIDAEVASNLLKEGRTVLVPQCTINATVLVPEACIQAGCMPQSRQRVYEVQICWALPKCSLFFMIEQQASPVGACLPLPFGSSIGSFNQGHYSSALGLGPITQPTSIASDKIDSPLPPFFRSWIWGLQSGCLSYI